MSEFRKELRAVINRYSKENGSNTPDFILAEYLTVCLESFDRAVNQRSEWYGSQAWAAVERLELHPELDDD